MSEHFLTGQRNFIFYRESPGSDDIFPKLYSLLYYRTVKETNKLFILCVTNSACSVLRTFNLNAGLGLLGYGGGIVKMLHNCNCITQFVPQKRARMTI